MKKRVRMKAPYRLRPVIIPLGFEILHERERAQGDVMLETHVLPKLIGKTHKIIAECIGITWVIFAQIIIIR